MEITSGVRYPTIQPVLLRKPSLISSVRNEKLTIPVVGTDRKPPFIQEPKLRNTKWLRIKTATETNEIVCTIL